MEEKKKNLLSELIYDEVEEFENLVPKVKRVVKVKKDGTPVIVCDRRRLSQSELITCYLIGKFFAKKLELTDTDTATNKELSKTLKMDERVVSARLKDLRDEGLVEQVARGEHKISTVNLESFLDKILEKIGEKE
jgi:DNA-binding transcriptional ArsR family regulator